MITNDGTGFGVSSSSIWRLRVWPRIFAVLVGAGLGTAAIAEPALTPATVARIVPVNPGADPAARALLRLIAQLPFRSPRHVLSGQMAGLVDGIPRQPAEEDATHGYQRFYVGVHDQSGKWPAILGVNYGRIASCVDPNPLVPTQHSPFLRCDGGPPDYRSTNRLLLDHAKAGGIVSVMWHTPNPWSGAGPKDQTIGRFADLYTPGTPMFRTWHRMLDDLAVGLTELRDAGAVVLFRPLHEQNGDWFWWGNHGAGKSPTPQEFALLWRDMFTYLSKTKDLHNLLWVYSPNRPGGSAGATDEASLVFDPGPAYYDIVGVDSYEDSRPRTLPYAAMENRGKPVGIAEFGPASPFDSDPATRGTFDDTRMLALLRQYPRLAFFMWWRGNDRDWSAMSQNRNARALLNDPLIANRDDLAGLRAGK